MEKENKDKFGDLMKSYENVFAQQKLDPTKPVCVRLDGKGFSKFTKGLNRPFDFRMSSCMIETTKFLLEKTNTKLGYTQSDEISLYFPPIKENSDFLYGARVQKLTSILSSFATAKFNDEVRRNIEEKKDVFAHFDCRVWNVPSLKVVGDTFKWRQQDCKKNSISMAAHHHFGHKETMNKNSLEKLEMLKSIKIDWNNYPGFFKYGTYIEPTQVESEIPEELKNYPSNLGKTHFTRTEYVKYSLINENEVYKIIENTNE